MKRALLAILLIVSLTGCNMIGLGLSELEADLKGRSMEIRSLDQEANVIDQIVGKSIKISSNSDFEERDSEGAVTKKSGVLSITIGGANMMHVGSSLIAAEVGLKDVFGEYRKTVDIKNNDSSVPILNEMINSMKNLTTGKDYVLLIRSQSGKPMATYVGNDISIFSTDIDKSTVFYIDGKILFVYRCDYSMYELSLLK